MQEQRPFPSVVFRLDRVLSWPHRLVEIEHFFQTYKALEDKTVDVVAWRDRDRAHDVLRADRKAWQLEHDLPTE